MANVIVTKNNKRFVKKATGLLITPHVYDTDDNKYYLGPDTYDIFSIVGDTISVTQEDGNTETLENEFSPIPVIENVTLGKWEFSADCIDMQNVVLKELFNAKVAQDGIEYVEGVVAMPSDYRTVYCCVQILFEDAPRLVLPKVLMTSFVKISSLRTNIATNKIHGTPLSTRICVANEEGTAALRFEDSAGNWDYCPIVPIAFVPDERDFGVYRNKYSVEEGISYFNMYESDKIVGVNVENGFISTIN